MERFSPEERKKEIINLEAQKKRETKEKILSTNYYKFEILEENEVVGRAFLFLIHNDLHQKPYGLLEDVFVEEEHRSKGIGCYKLIATSRFERENVHQLYENLGFKKWGYEFRMDLL